MKDLIKSINDDFPSAKHNLLSMLSNDKQVDLWSPTRKNIKEMDEWNLLHLFLKEKWAFMIDNPEYIEYSSAENKRLEVAVQIST